MKVKYVSVQDKQNNTFKHMPVSVEGCCHDSMLWFFRNKLDIVMVDAIFVTRNVDNNVNGIELFHCCQFCGSRHETVLVSRGIDNKNK